MSARLIDGAAHAAGLRNRVADRVRGLGFAPGLAVILVGDDAASAVYVAAKHRQAAAVGIRSFVHTLPTETTQAALLGLIDRLNVDEAVHGILVQLPLPAGIATQAVLNAVDPAKDVDGFHPLNVGKLALGQPTLVPCTPQGCLHLLHATLGTTLAGANALILGRSTLVGKPMAQLLLTANATVTLAHSHSRDLPDLCRRADIVVAAVGRPGLVQGDWLKPGATVIDVGINRVDGKLVGDVDFASARMVAGAITPVPGGVGPMTIACLLANTVRVATDLQS